MPNKSTTPTLSKTNSKKQISVESNLYGKGDDLAMVSRAKLNHLQDMADDDRMDEPYISFDGAFGALSTGLFFTGLSWLINFKDLSEFWKALCVVAIAIGAGFTIYCFGRNFFEIRKRKKYRGKISKKIKEIIGEMDDLKNEKTTNT